MRLYGITTSEAHYWIHVTPKDGGIYLYPRKWMAAIHERFQERVISSARGRLAPLPTILLVNGGRARFVDLGYERMDRYAFDTVASDRRAGDLAERCFVEAAADGLVCLPVIVQKKYETFAQQTRGMDYAVRLLGHDVEIKADIAGGMWGTGNLFIQTHEGTTADGDRHRFDERNGHR